MKLTEKKRKQIILAAVDEFKAHGFSNTSMDSIAKGAQVSKRTVYNHFSCKETLFSGIVDYMFTLMKEQSLPQYQKNKPLKQQLIEIALQKITLFSSNFFIDISKVVIPEGIHNPERILHALDQLEEVEKDIDNWFEQAIADKRIEKLSAHQASEKFIGLIKLDAFWPRLFKGISAPNEQEALKIATEATCLFLAYYQTADKD